VLVVANSGIAASTTLAATYMQGRQIPAGNLLTLPLTTDVTNYSISQANLQTQIYVPIANAIADLRSRGTRIDFIVLMYGMPYLINSGTFSGYSVDGMLTQVLGPFPTNGGMGNPYAYQTGAFSSTTYAIELVTRLDGRSVADVTSLIQQSLASDGTHPHGEFFFDYDPGRQANGYASFNQMMQTAQATLANDGFDAQIDLTNTFVAPAAALEGYASWGSNDFHFSQTAYNALRFVAGGIAETAVSTSASNIRTPGGGQSQIADLIHQGVTGVHGDVTEPYLSAIPDPSAVFPNYTAGRTLAEAFYSGLIIIAWKEVVIGDPICRPYAGAGTSSIGRSLIRHAGPRLPLAP
jgi:uncharacterized protein (TIGR03790 family)